MHMKMPVGKLFLWRSYSFKRHNELFNKVLNEKMKLENVEEEDKDKICKITLY